MSVWYPGSNTFSFTNSDPAAIAARRRAMFDPATIIARRMRDGFRRRETWPRAGNTNRWIAEETRRGLRNHRANMAHTIDLRRDKPGRYNPRDLATSGIRRAMMSRGPFNHIGRGFAGRGGAGGAGALGVPGLDFTNTNQYAPAAFPQSPTLTPFAVSSMPLAPSVLRHLYPGGTGFGGGGFGGMFGGGGGAQRFGPPGKGPRANPGPPAYRDGQMHEEAFWDRTDTPWGRRTVERSWPGMGERMQGRWRADNRPPGGWRAEAWDRGHNTQGRAPVRRGRDQFDTWGLLRGLLQGAGKNLGEGRHSRANIFRGGIAGLLREPYLW